MTSDVWSLALSLMEVAQNRFPFPPEGESPLLPIELLQYIVNNPVEQLRDEKETGVKWSSSFKHFLKSWYAIFLSFVLIVAWKETIINALHQDSY